MKLTVRIMRMWEHSNMDSTVLHGPNFLMVDHKVKFITELQSHISLQQII